MATENCIANRACGTARSGLHCNRACGTARSGNCRLSPFASRQYKHYDCDVTLVSQLQIPPILVINSQGFGLTWEGGNNIEMQASVDREKSGDRNVTEKVVTRIRS